MAEIRLAILASGGGTTAEAIIKSGVVDVVLVVSNNSQVGVKERAERLEIPFKHMPRAPFAVNGKIDAEESKIKYGQVLLDLFDEFGVTHVSQNGWMIKTPKNVIDHFGLRIVNQHPGPLDPPKNPDFGGQGMYGERVHAAVLNFKDAITIKRPFEFTEATIHIATEEFDEGLLLMTRQVPILKGDDAETLAMRMLPVEHAIQIEFWKRMQEGRVEPFRRDTRLILPGEFKILEEAKRKAIADSPSR